MKKIFKGLVVIGAIVGGAAGAVYLLSRKNKDDFGDFDDEDFEDIFAEDEEDDRDYVTLDIDAKEQKEDVSKESGEEETAQA